MCKLGDIIVVDKYISHDGIEMNRHSFVVISDKPGFVEGVSYDLVASVMSSFKNEEQKFKKLKFEENLEVVSDDIISDSKNTKNGFIKADQLNYFDKSKIKYYVLGHISEDLLDELMILIMALDKKGKLINNLNNITS